MKKLKKLFILLIIPIMVISCGSDDDAIKEIIPGPPTGTDVRYKFTVSSADVVTSFKYKSVDGTMESGFFNDVSPLSFSKTIIVQKPFLTKMDLNFQNKTGVDHNYSVEIYVDGVLSDTQVGTVPAPPVVPVNPEVPYPPFSVTKTYLVN
ncbi:hypothetical protein FNO01nite_09500 [Flavobacterium noncentrifugens]|uniref:Uncharacterized protein n=1 Tax=Flavobacterium noncentrifugens TaxID=1128970 RepID=A0A1G8UZI0_9FLAO|nr:hypothetical protein [Flavobacterium noncentrifugens]GEP50278.1 hypothetical protein FNO01nite_09500 [Flavobacterium noncentrifugens]SDJ59228.1 hypothetical protein SAMN04487935_1119 [Flavobacterium noncentrifugens]